MPILIVGAGIAGLTAGEILSRAGKNVVIVERENEIGGLARSFSYNNGFSFDMGPHRFHTNIPDASQYIDQILNGDQIRIRRSSSVYFYGRYCCWPLTLLDVLHLPPLFLFKCTLDLFFKKATGNDDESFTSYIIKRYGKTIYRHFFENYTMKFLRLSPDCIHKNWASASINRAIIDDKIIKRSASLFNLTLGMILPKKIETTFIYPGSGPNSVFIKKQAGRIKSKGGTILSKTEVVSFEESKGSIIRAVLSNGETVECEEVIFTAPITALCELLGRPRPCLKFLSTVFFNLVAYGRPKLPYQWCYFGEKTLIFSRISCMNFFNRKLLPDDDSTALSVELPTYKGDMIWEHPEKFLNLIIQDLIRVGYINNFNEIQSFHIERVENTYPVYELDYLAELGKSYKSLEGLRNLWLLGRCGTFWYNNMDHSIKMAIDISNHILNGIHVPVGNYKLDL
ncbi:FAD-binding protein [Candidatus Parcubacteria bacterium]|nr:MAG: FAD-binding protein [Candidatus Parcubacteria bacterium]